MSLQKILNDNNETMNFAQPIRSNADTTFEPKIDLTGAFSSQETQIYIATKIVICY